MALAPVSATASLKGLLPRVTLNNPNAVRLSTNSDAAFDGNRYLTVWSQGLSLPDLDIYGRFVDRSGEVSGPQFTIISRARLQFDPVVSYNGSYYLVVYTDNTGTNPQADTLHGRIISPNGSLVGAEFLIATGSPSLQSPAIATDGEGFLVVWQGGRGQLISVDNTGFAALDGAPFPIGGAGEERNLSVAFGNTRYLVAWQRDPAPNANQADVFGATVSTFGLVSSEFPISTGPGQQFNPDVVYGGGNFLVTFADKRNDDNPTNFARSVRVSPDGTLLDGPSDTGGIELSVTNLSDVALTGDSSWLIVGSDFSALYKAVELSFDGTILESGTPFPRTGKTIFDGVNWLTTYLKPDQCCVQVIPAAFVAQVIGIFPDATDDTYAVDEDMTLNIPAPGVLANDFDKDGDSLTAVMVTLPEHGAVTLSGNGSFSYTPNPNFTGLDHFIYDATDGVRESNHAVVTVSVNMVNDPPTALADGPYLAIQGDTITVDASSSSDVEGSPLTFEWDFGDGTTLTTTDRRVDHIYEFAGEYSIRLDVNDGELDSVLPFITYATIGTPGGGQRNDVDVFLAYASPVETRTDVEAGVTDFDVTIIYGPSIEPLAFQATLNGQPYFAFHPSPGTAETVTVPLDSGRNTLKLVVEGVRTDGRTATDRDQLVFILP